jgi:hypothetical protein
VYMYCCPGRPACGHRSAHTCMESRSSCVCGWCRSCLHGRSMLGSSAADDSSTSCSDAYSTMSNQHDLWTCNRGMCLSILFTVESDHAHTTFRVLQAAKRAEHPMCEKLMKLHGGLQRRLQCGMSSGRFGNDGWLDWCPKASRASRRRSKTPKACARVHRG